MSNVSRSNAGTRLITHGVMQMYYTHARVQRVATFCLDVKGLSVRLMIHAQTSRPTLLRATRAIVTRHARCADREHATTDMQDSCAQAHTAENFHLNLSNHL